MAPITTIGKRLAKYSSGTAWEVLGALFDNELVIDPEDFSWTRVEFHFSRTTPAGHQEDRAITKLDLCSLDDIPTVGALSSGERTTAQGILDPMWGGLLSRIANNHTLVEWRWYDMRFATPMTEDQRFLERGAPVLITADTRSGSDSESSRAIYQSALSVTFKTAARRHWGRMYIPGVSSSQVNTNGRFTPTCTDAFRDAFGTAWAALVADGTHIMVPSTRVDGQLEGAILFPHQLQVDDVPDVIRRRRPKSASVRDVYP